MNADAIKHMIENGIPFNRLVGSKLVEISPEHAIFSLSPRPELLNHFQTLHAAAVFTLGEGTAGAIIAAGFDVETYLLMIKTAEIRYRRPAKQATAQARLDPAVREQALSELAQNGKVDIAIDVVISNEQNEECGYAHYVWALRPRS